ncbi:keratin-associated protein 6-2 [Ricinus communis]|uniref:Uncharacterized protein n=1 Tax=Ricinus communis TaxID=3988 RepID=B9RJA7_RICCO|nr:keratin-associated protein 6-2 [Ricinus communis]EEF48409.1 conserved hypothetical protein [Ricinus communis]|eukprot:XP_002513826.1 keratin-associated protein 6-2 [Ricinus communis]
MAIKLEEYVKVMLVLLAFAGHLHAHDMPTENNETASAPTDQGDNTGGTDHSEGWVYRCGCDAAPDGSWNYNWGTGSGPDGSTYGYGSGSGQSPDGGGFGFGWGSSSSSAAGSTDSYGFGTGDGDGSYWLENDPNHGV